MINLILCEIHSGYCTYGMPVQPCLLTYPKCVSYKYILTDNPTKILNYLYRNKYMSRQFVYKKVYVAYTFIYSTYNYASQTHGIMQCVYGTNEYNPHKKYCCNLFRTQKKQINNILQQKRKNSGQENKQNPTLVSQLLQ